MSNEKGVNVIIVQPALPAYRVDFFERISKHFGDRFRLYYSPTDMGEITDNSSEKPWANKIGSLKKILPGMEWQQGALGVPIRQGDIVVISGAPRCISNLVLLVRARWVGAKTVWWGHYWSATSKKHRFLLRLLLMKLAHGLLFYTDEEVASYRDSYGKTDTRPASALNNGLNIDPIKALRVPYDPVARGNTLLFIGRLTKKANLDLLLHALAQPALVAVKLHVIGNGEKEGDYKQLAHQLAIGDRVVWHAGTTNEQEIASVANQCALFVYPGAVGLSLIHAMAYGLPALVHNRRKEHMPEIAAFKDGVTGISFSPEDPVDLGEKVDRIIHQLPLREIMSSFAIDGVENSFNTSVMASRLSGLISTLGRAR